MIKNMLVDSDSYKLSHYRQYPPGTTGLYSYIEARSPHITYSKSMDCVVFAGMRRFTNDLLGNVSAFDSPKLKIIADQMGLEWNEEGFVKLWKKHHGALPIRIKSAFEGEVIPVGMPLVTIESTDPEFFWLPSFLETALLRAIWYPTTVATISWHIKLMMAEFWQISSDSPFESLNYKLHDFGSRGASSEETARIGAMAHLINFVGTDTLVAESELMRVYGAYGRATSIPAAEHSTITSWGKPREADAYRNIIKEFGGEGKVFAVVSDSYGIESALNIYKDKLKREIQENGGTLVVRPDSGDPTIVPISTIQFLMDTFGFETNSKGFDVLPPYIRVIQGDGVDVDSIAQILDRMDRQSLAIDNIAFGMGGALLQKVDRDTFGFAMKCSAVELGDKWVDVKKEAPGKRSKAGRVTTVFDPVTNKFIATTEEDPVISTTFPALHLVYENGVTHNREPFGIVVNRAENALLARAAISL